jgi:hypothetical protein
MVIFIARDVGFSPRKHKEWKGSLVSKLRNKEGFPFPVYHDCFGVSIS